mgnify:CR=1 FL=1|tara:strand:- start:6 stop:1010 length:1005 start_codon:yes stop_codon:yes gene_type:complete
MKEILGNWNKFINEQESPPVQVRLELLARANLGLNNAKYDKIWSKIVERTKNFNLEKLANSVRKEVFYTFDSELAEKSFVRMARQKDLGGINSKTTDEEILKQYREVYLPKIKNILESVPVINLASEQATGNKTFKRAIEFATNSAKDGKGVRGFFSYFVDSEKGYIAVVPYFHMRKNGTLGLGAIKRTLLEEFIHAVDIIMGGAPPESSGIQPSATGKGFFSKILAGDFEKITTKKPEDLPQRAYDYLTKPEEVYAKLKRIKIKLKDSKLGIGTVFDKDGKIDLDQLKLFLEDPDSQDAYPILRILNIKKLEDIGKVLDQIARVDQQKNTQIA